MVRESVHELSASIMMPTMWSESVPPNDYVCLGLRWYMSLLSMRA